MRHAPAETEACVRLVQAAGPPPPAPCPSCGRDRIGIAGCLRLGYGVVLVRYSCAEGHLWPVLLRHPSFPTELRPEDRVG